MRSAATRGVRGRCEVIPGVAIVCASGYDECALCGGSATLGGTQEAIEVGPVTRFCGMECHDEWQEHFARGRRPDWCPSCGYDQHEHAPDCSPAAVSVSAVGEK